MFPVRSTCYSMKGDKRFKQQAAAANADMKNTSAKPGQAGWCGPRGSCPFRQTVDRAIKSRDYLKYEAKRLSHSKIKLVTVPCGSGSTMYFDLLTRGWPSLAMLPLILLMFCAFIEAFPTTFEGLSTSSNASLLWGPYRPNLYLGIRPRIPNSLLMGLMWSNADNPSDILRSTH